MQTSSTSFTLLPCRRVTAKLPLLLLSLLAFFSSTFASPPLNTEDKKPPNDPQADASCLIETQAKPKVMPRVLQKATPDNTSLYISLKKQRAWFFVDQEVAIDTPISSGKQAAMTPKGSFGVAEKLEKRESSTYGDFIDRKGNPIRIAVSSKLDSAPSGTCFRATPVHYYLSLGNSAPALHAGYLPGYPAAHANVRLPEEIARLIFEQTKIGTPVTIGD